jgi:hypothetical protein
MIITNKNNHPKPLAEAVRGYQFDYKKGSIPNSISTTVLISPVQAVELQRRYDDKITQDVSDMMWALRGQIEHGIMEAAAKTLDTPGAIVEKRFSTEVLGWTVAGKIDYYEDGILYDYKDVSVWAYIFGDKKWELQANVNRYLMAKNGIDVKRFRNTLIFRDFQKSKAGTGRYPPRGVYDVDIPMWTLEHAEIYVKERVKLFQEARQQADNELIECEHEDRMWNKKQDKYMRCTEYCLAREFCQQIKREGGK